MRAKSLLQSLGFVIVGTLCIAMSTNSVMIIIGGGIVVVGILIGLDAKWRSHE